MGVHDSMSRGSDIVMMVGGQVVGKTQSIDASKAYGTREYLPKGEPISGFIGRSAALLGTGFARINHEALLKAMGAAEQAPKFDIKAEEWKQARPLPNGRVRLPKNKRLRKKWMKRYGFIKRTTYYGCELVDSREERANTAEKMVFQYESSHI
jgi:hypothetical protein